MSEEESEDNETSGGAGLPDGPAFGVDVMEEAGIPSLKALRVALADSSELVAACLDIAGDHRLTPESRSQAAMAAARLIAASAQTASAIARIADSGTRQQLASARIHAEREKSTNECLARQAGTTS